MGKSFRDQIHRMNKGAMRESQMEQGAFDGRFKERVVKSKKAYDRSKDRKGWRGGLED
jgi:hypothetical protein